MTSNDWGGSPNATATIYRACTVETSRTVKLRMTIGVLPNGLSHMEAIHFTPRQNHTENPAMNPNDASKIANWKTANPMNIDTISPMNDTSTENQ